MEYVIALVLGAGLGYFIYTRYQATKGTAASTTGAKGTRRGTRER